MNASTVVIDNGIGNVALNGSLTVNPTQDTIYTMIATGTGGIENEALAFVYINDGRKIFAYVPNYTTKIIKVFDTTNNSQIAAINIWGNLSQDGCVAFSPFGDRVYYGNKTQGSIWEIDPGFNDINDAYYFNFGPSFITISPDGRFLYAGCGASPYDTLPNKDKTIVGVYDLRDKKIIRQVRVDRKVQTDFSLSPDGSILYVVADGILQAFDTEKLRVPQISNPDDCFVDLADELKWGIPQCPAIAVHPDGNRVFVAGNPIKVIDVSTQTVMKTLDTSGDVLKLYLSPNGERLFVTPDMRVYAAFNLSPWTKQGELLRSPNYGFGISPEGKQIYFLSNSYSSNLSIADSATMQLLTWVTLERSVGTNGNFVGQIADTVTGKVTLNGDALGGVQMHLTGSDVNYSIWNHDDGSFCTAVRNGSYTVSAEKVGYVFTPQQQEVNVTSGSVTDINFEGNTVAPVLRVWATPERIDKGEVATLFWESQNAISVTLNGSGCAIPSGKRDVSPSVTTTYNFTAEGPGGSVNAELTVYIGSKLPGITASVDPATIISGQSSTITWASTDATSVSIDQGIGAVALSGSKVVTPAQTTTYTLTVTGPGGTATANVIVTVTSPATPTVTISATPVVIQVGGSSTLIWATTNAASASIDNGVGVVPVNGSVSVSPTATTTYTITATGAGGSASVSVKVTVGEALPTITFSATPEFIPPGGSSTLAWTIKDATSASVDYGIGVVDLSGSQAVTPTSETTYTLTAIGPGGTATASVTIKMLDSLLRGVWNGMKTAMASQNIEQAVGCFLSDTQKDYRDIFNALTDTLPQIVQGMQEIEPVYYEENGAQYRIKRHEVIQGSEYDMTYYIYFMKDENGIWKILRF